MGRDAPASRRRASSSEMIEVRGRIRVLGSGCWVLGSVRGSGFWVRGSGFWVRAASAFVTEAKRNLD
jgi:hypothetical protein